MPYKISKIIRCSCKWLHITQGPISCWVCQDSVSFEKWQTGKGEEKRKKPGFGKDVQIDGTIRPYPEDPRDRIKDEGTYIMCWPDEIGSGKRGQDWLWGAGL